MMRHDNNEDPRQHGHRHLHTFVDMDGYSEERRPQFNEGNMPSSLIAAGSSGPPPANTADWEMVDVPSTVGHDGHETISTHSGHGPSEPRDETGRRRRAPVGRGAARGAERRHLTREQLQLLDAMNRHAAGYPVDIGSWAAGTSPAYVGPSRHEGPHHVSGSLRVRGGARTHASDASSAFAPVHSPDAGGLDAVAINAVGAWQEEQSLPPHMYYHNAGLELDPY